MASDKKNSLASLIVTFVAALVLSIAAAFGLVGYLTHLETVAFQNHQLAHAPTEAELTKIRFNVMHGRESYTMIILNHEAWYVGPDIQLDFDGILKGEVDCQRGIGDTDISFSPGAKVHLRWLEGEQIVDHPTAHAVMWR